MRAGVGVMALAMKIAGVKAGVIDGPATDLSEIEEFDMPMWCRGLSSITTRLLGLEGAMNVPISVGGQTVNPGDAVLADEQGVLVFPPALAREAAERAIAMQEREKTSHQRLRAGEKLPDMSGAIGDGRGEAGEIQGLNSDPPRRQHAHVHEASGAGCSNGGIERFARSCAADDADVCRATRGCSRISTRRPSSSPS